MGLDEHFEMFICSDIPAISNSQGTGMLNLRFFFKYKSGCMQTH